MASVRRSREQQTVENRAAVLSAARHVFAERGYGAATLEQIAEAAGFSKGVVYSQFASKADLFLNVLDQRVTERAAENQAAVDASDGLDLDATVRQLHRLMSRSDPEWRLAVTEFRIAAARDSELRARYEAVHRRTVARLAEVFDQIFANARLPLPVPADHLAMTMLALDVGTVVEDTSSTTPIPDDSLDILIRRLVFGA